MRSSHILIVCVLFLIENIISGCTSATEAAPVNTLVIATQTTLLIKTVSSPPTVSSTPTVKPTLILTPYATLSQIDAEQTVKKMMRENGNCIAPCFWGLIPDNTSLQDAVAWMDTLYRSFGRKGVFVGSENSQTLYNATFHIKDKMDIGIVLWEKSDDLLNIDVQVFGLSDKNISSDDWLAFRPESLMKTYGVPKQVNIYLSQSPVEYSYGLIFYYDQLIVEYHNGDIVPSESTHICPLREHETESFYFLLGSELKHTPIGEKNIEEITQLAVDDFYALLTGDPRKACFDVNFDAYRK